ncbi:MAG: DUF389 domain-containing protein [Kofleriaceae bacterium]
MQDRVLGSFGRFPGDRGSVVRAMLQPRNGDAAGYWLQLVIATMLATLGLALNSTAVVIGAMLIAPLMRPLVELAMGLATGSAGLVLRALIRTVASIGLCVMVAMAITWLLPFREITAEIESRTAPTLLDLAVAGACALAAAYASLRADADIATTAAGTSIGISLVPPLCAAGYGISIGDEAVWHGAALLFTANLSGILVLATLLFVLAGFSQVDIRAEESTLDADRVGRSLRIGRAWSRLIATRLGPLSRIIPPLALLAIVYLPLDRAIGEIRRRNQIRENVVQILGSDHRRVVQFTLDQPTSGVILRAVVVGDAPTASDLESDLRARLNELGVRSPKVSVWAVPDAAAMSALTTRLDSIPAPAPPPEPAPIVARRHSTELVEAIRSAWPTSGTGALVEVWHDLDHPQKVRVIHLGAPLGDAGMQLLSRTLATLGAYTVEEEALLPIDAPFDDGATWLPEALRLIARASRVPALRLCLTIPVERAPVPRGDKAKIAEANRSRATIISFLPDSLPKVVTGDSWSITPRTTPCDPAPLAP